MIGVSDVVVMPIVIGTLMFGKITKFWLKKYLYNFPHSDLILNRSGYFLGEFPIIKIKFPPLIISL